MLRVISLKGNKLTKPVMDMKALSKVHTFHLYGNPVEYLPEMHHCKSLRCLSLVNVVVSANDDLTDVDVQIGDTTSSYIPRRFRESCAERQSVFGFFYSRVQTLELSTFAYRHRFGEDCARRSLELCRNWRHGRRSAANAHDALDFGRERHSRSDAHHRRYKSTSRYRAKTHRFKSIAKNTKFDGGKSWFLLFIAPHRFLSFSPSLLRKSTTFIEGTKINF